MKKFTEWMENRDNNPWLDDIRREILAGTSGNVADRLESQIKNKLGSLSIIKAALPPENFRIAVQSVAETFELVAQSIEDAQTNDRDDVLKHYKGWTTQEFEEYAERLRKLARMLSDQK